MAEFIEGIEKDLIRQLKPHILGLYKRYRDVYISEADLISDSYQIIHQATREYDSNRNIPLIPFVHSRLKWGVYSIARSRRKLAQRFVPFEDSYIPSVVDDYAVLEIDERKQYAISAVQYLSERQRTLLMLRYVEEWSYSDIAEKMEIKEATVRSLVRHALQNIRKRVRSFDDQYIK